MRLSLSSISLPTRTNWNNSTCTDKINHFFKFTSEKYKKRAQSIFSLKTDKIFRNDIYKFFITIWTGNFKNDWDFFWKFQCDPHNITESMKMFLEFDWIFKKSVALQFLEELMWKDLEHFVDFYTHNILGKSSLALNTYWNQYEKLYEFWKIYPSLVENWTFPEPLYGNRRFKNILVINKENRICQIWIFMKNKIFMEYLWKNKIFMINRCWFKIYSLE